MLGERGLRHLFFVLGLLSLALGLIGAVLPIMPTSPFMIVALWCFARSSQRFHDWLYFHPIFGPPLRDWHQHRVIPLWGKVAAIAGFTGSLTMVIFFGEFPWYVPSALAVVMALVIWWILSKPSRPMNAGLEEGERGEVHQGEQ